MINRNSIARTVRRTIQPEELKIVELEGYVRKWQLVDAVIVEGREQEGPLEAVFLDLERDEAGSVNGILVPVIDSDLKRLDGREKNYDRINVTAAISTKTKGAVFTYIGKAEFTNPGSGALVLRGYEELIEEGLSHWGDEFTRNYYASTIPSELPCCPGHYVFCDEQQNAMAGRERHSSPA